MLKYCSIDIETTGLDPDTCDLLEVGMVVDDLNAPLELEQLPRFHCYVEKEIYQGSGVALSMHPQIFKRIAAKEAGYNYLREEVVAREMANFLYANFPCGTSNIIVAGKNYSGFDKLFLRKLPGFNKIKISHRVLDPGNLYLNLLTDDDLPSSKKCMELAGMKDEVAHTAIEDALMVVKLIRNKVKEAYLLNEERKVPHEFLNRGSRKEFMEEKLKVAQK